MVSLSNRELSSALTGLSTGLIAVSSIIMEPLPRVLLIGIGSLCATVSIYLQFGGRTGDDGLPDFNSEYMRGLQEGVALGKEITESGGSIPPSLQSETENDDEFDTEYE